MLQYVGGVGLVLLVACLVAAYAPRGPWRRVAEIGYAAVLVLIVGQLTLHAFA